MYVVLGLPNENPFGKVSVHGPFDTYDKAFDFAVYIWDLPENNVVNPTTCAKKMRYSVQDLINPEA